LIKKNYINDIESLLYFKDLNVIIKNLESTDSNLDIYDTLRDQIQEE